MAGGRGRPVGGGQREGRPQVRLQVGPDHCVWWLAPSPGAPFVPVVRGRPAPWLGEGGPAFERWRALGAPELLPALEPHARPLGLAPTELQDLIERTASEVGGDGDLFDLEDWTPAAAAALARMGRLSPAAQARVLGPGGPGGGHGALIEATPSLCDLTPPVWWGDAGGPPSLLDAPEARERAPWVWNHPWTRAVRASFRTRAVVWVWEGERLYRMSLRAREGRRFLTVPTVIDAFLYEVSLRTEDGKQRILVQGFHTELGELRLSAVAIDHHGSPPWCDVGDQGLGACQPHAHMPPVPPGHIGPRLELVARCTDADGRLPGAQAFGALHRLIDAAPALVGGTPLADD